MCDINRHDEPLNSPRLALAVEKVETLDSGAKNALIWTNLTIPIPAIMLAQLFEFDNLCPAKGQSSRNGESKSSSKAMRSLAGNGLLALAL